MADALGKPGAGILKGNLYEVGNYDQCLATTAYEEHTWVAGTGPKTSRVERFKGEFCRVTINLPKSFVDGLGVVGIDSFFFSLSMVILMITNHQSQMLNLIPELMIIPES